MVVAFYVRTPYGESLDSPAALLQLDKVKERAVRLGFDLTDARVFHDAGSTESPERPGFEALEQSISDGNVDAVFTDGPDRLSRDIKVFVAFLRRCKKGGVAVHFLDGSVDGMLADLEWVFSPRSQH